MYNVVFKGEIAKSQPLEEVKKKIALLYNVDVEKTERLFKNKSIILKENLDYHTALKDKETFEQTGAICHIEAAELPKGEPPPIPIQAENKDNSNIHERRDLKNLTGKSVTKESDRRYSIYHPLYLSFFSKDFYYDVGANWKGFSIVYMIFVLFLSALILTIISHGQTAKTIRDRAAPIVKQIPVITISQGKASINENQPFIIVDPETGKDIIIIDTLNENSAANYPEPMILMTQTRLILNNFGQKQIFKLSQFGNDTIVVDDKLLEKILNLSIIMASLFNFISVFFIYLFIYSIQIMIYAFFGFWYSKYNKIIINHKSLISISIVATTPIIILNSFLGLGFLFHSFWIFISFLVPIGFLIFGIKAYSEFDYSSYQE